MSVFEEGGLRDLEMNHEGMAGDCPGVTESAGSVWDSSLGLATSVRILTDRDFLGLPLVWWCLWTVFAQNLTQWFCHACSGGWLQTQALSHVALECASPVDQPCLHCGASLGVSLHDLVSDSRVQVCQEQVP